MLLSKSQIGVCLASSNLYTRPFDGPTGSRGNVYHMPKPWKVYYRKYSQSIQHMQKEYWPFTGSSYLTQEKNLFEIWTFTSIPLLKFSDMVNALSIIPLNLPDGKILDLSKLKAFADVNLNVNQKLKIGLGRVKTLLEKEKMLVINIFSFSHNVFKRLFP